MDGEIKRDIETFNDCYNRLMKIGNENLSPFVNNLQQGNLHIIEVLFTKYLNGYKSLNEGLSKEYELGAAQARYENNKDWEERLKGERANCIYKAGSYDIDNASIQQHKYIGGFEAINRILKDI